MLPIKTNRVLLMLLMLLITVLMLLSLPHDGRPDALTPAPAVTLPATPPTAPATPTGVSPKAPTGTPKKRSSVLLPTDPLLRTAAQALRGDFGKLKPWQQVAYELAAKGKHHHLRLWVTQYWPGEGRDSRHTASGAPVSLRVAAANRIPRGSYVWIANPPHMRQVLDCGAHSNDRCADRNGCDAWIDLWVPRAGWHGLDTMTTEAVVLSP
jgi:hypothetical protein